MSNFGPVALSLDLGVPPLDLLQALQLVKLHFRYSYDSSSTLPDQLYALQLQWKHKFPADAIVNRVEQAFSILKLASQYPSLQPLPMSVTNPSTRQKEKAYGRFLQQKVSAVWREVVLLRSPLLNSSQVPNTRMAAYTHIWRMSTYSGICFLQHPTFGASR